MSSTKRSDLQGIRGLAILSVLGFHFYPDHFPNGYLGVDQFFVLSGFLMQMLLDKSKNKSPFSLILTFHSRRFRRILPLYLFFICVSLTFLYNAFPSSSVETNLESASRALVFVSNRPKTGAEDYFQMLSIAIDIFTHTWSLSVEVQFYLMVPFVFLLTAQLPRNAQIMMHMIIGLLSFSFHSISSTSTVAFNSVFARIWQFSIGMTAFILSTCLEDVTGYCILKQAEQEEEEGSNEKFILDLELQNRSLKVEKKNHLMIQLCKGFTVLSVISITNFPVLIPAVFVRPFITVCTALIILISHEDFLLSNRVLTYIGDISYSLYLIHWPVYAYWKLTGGSVSELLIYLIASIILSVIIYETFEKWYLQLSSTSIGVLVSFLFLLNVLLIDKDKFELGKVSWRNDTDTLDHLTDSKTFEDAARLNYLWSVNDNKNLFTPSCVYEGVDTPLGWCRHKVQGLTGKYKLAIFGNSWTANHATLFYQECGYKAKSILQGSAYACEPLYPTWHKEVCEANFTDFEERIKAEKPDYGFIVTRFMTVGQEPLANETSLDVDPIYQTMLSQTLKLIENIQIKLFILDAIPRLWAEKIDKIVPMLKSQMTPKQIDEELVELAGFDIARKRQAQLVKDCGAKCELIDYVPTFFNTTTGTFRYFDERGFSYYTAATHLSPHGLEHVRHVWRAVCDRL